MKENKNHFKCKYYGIPWREGRLSLNHQQFWCAQVQGDEWTKEIIWIIGYENKKMSVKSSSKHTKRQPYWFSKCSGIPFSWSGDVCGLPGSKTNGQWQLIVHKVPFQVYAAAFPSCSVLAAATQTSTNNIQLSSLKKQTTTARNDNIKRIH